MIKKTATFLELAKPRLTILVVFSTFTGYYLGANGAIHFGELLNVLIGIALASGGALALNQYLEREFDAQMKRTRHRPLPSGRLQPKEAAFFGVFLCLAGITFTAFAVNMLTSLLVFLTILSYLFAYTPLKRKTALNTAVGAIPGALPVVCGWTGARNTLDVESLVLFGILFFWQFPHFLSIALLYRNDYQRAGFKMMPAMKNGDRWTHQHIIAACIALMIVSILPVVSGLTGVLYFVVALLAGLVFLGYGVCLAIFNTPAFARRLMLASFIYPLLVWGFMIIDKTNV